MISSRDPRKRWAYDRQRAKQNYPPIPQPSSPPRPPLEQTTGAKPHFDEDIAARVIYEAIKHSGSCQVCGEWTPTRQTRLGYNVGMIVMRRVVEIDGLLCRGCIEKKYWEFNGKLLLFGWWGVIPFFATWFYLITNFFTYLMSLTLETEEDNLFEIAFGWKLVNGAVVVLLVWILSGAQLPGSPAAAAAQSVTPTARPAAVAVVATPAVSTRTPYLPAPKGLPTNRYQ